MNAVEALLTVRSLCCMRWSVTVLLLHLIYEEGFGVESKLNDFFFFVALIVVARIRSIQGYRGLRRS